MIEYASMSCGHCAAFHDDTYPTIKAEYIDTGKVRFIFREFPLDLQAAAASMVARCVGNGDPAKYHDDGGSLFATQDEWVRTAHAQRSCAGSPNKAGLDEGAFRRLSRQPGDGRRAQARRRITPACKLKVDFDPDLLRQRYPDKGRLPDRRVPQGDRGEPEKLSLWKRKGLAINSYF